MAANWGAVLCERNAAGGTIILANQTRSPMEVGCNFWMEIRQGMTGMGV
jgi:hypothetical protein